MVFFDFINKYIASMVSINTVTHATPFIPYPCFTAIKSKIKFNTTANILNTNIFPWFPIVL